MERLAYHAVISSLAVHPAHPTSASAVLPSKTGNSEKMEVANANKAS